MIHVVGVGGQHHGRGAVDAVGDGEEAGVMNDAVRKTGEYTMVPYQYNVVFI